MRIDLTPTITEPTIVADNNARDDHQTAAVLDFLIGIAGPTAVGRWIFPGHSPTTPRGARRVAAATTKLSRALDAYGAHDADRSEEVRLWRALNGARWTIAETEADLARADGDWPGSSIGEALSDLRSRLEDHAQDLCVPGLWFGALPDDGTVGAFWYPSDEDYCVTPDGSVTPDDFGGGGPAELSAHLYDLSENGWTPDVWLTDDGGEPTRGPIADLGDLCEGADTAYPRGEVVNWRGVAAVVTRRPWSGAPTTYGIVMVGDDIRHDVEVGDLTPLAESGYCGGCGQVGCGHAATEEV